MSLPDVLSWKHNHEPGIVCREQPDGSLAIAEWPAALGSFPTAAQIATWTSEYNAALPDIEAADGLRTGFEASKIARLSFNIKYDQESRLRVLEARPAITRAQYRDAMIAAYKALP